MLGRWLAIVRKDLVAGSRDQLTTYVVLGPIVLGLLMAALMPLLEGDGIRVAVTEGLEPRLLDALQHHGSVETLPDPQAVEQRVLQRDDVVGLVATGGQPTLLLHGNEPPALAEQAGAIVDRAAAGLPPVAPHDGPPMRPIVAALLGFCVVVLMGLAAGFTILEETTTEISRALAVTPVRFAEHALAKIGTSVVLSLVLVPCALIIPLGGSLPWGAVLLAALASAPFALSLGLLVGAYAKDQLGAVAIMKGLLPVWTSLPIASFVLSEAWQPVLWPLSNHWGVQAFYDALTGGPSLGAHLGLTLATGVPVLAATLWWLRRRLRLG